MNGVRGIRYSTGAVALITLLVATPAAAQTDLEGEVGVDMGVYSLSNHLLNAQRRYDVDRQLSRQFLSLRFAGPVVNPNFAEANFRARLAGTYYGVDNTSDGSLGRQTDYIDPMLDNVLGTISLFPTRTYPVRYTFGKITHTTNRYEPGRRADFQLDNPGLAVLRRYNSNAISHALQSQVSFTQTMNLAAELRHEENEIARQYDFGEDMDIWVEMLSQPPDGQPTHNVDVVNSLNDVVLLYVDFALVDTLLAGELLTINLTDGSHEADFVPRRFNPFSTPVNVRSNMMWRIVHNPPKGSSDLEQTSDAGEVLFRVDQGRVRNETRLLYNNVDENVQGTSSGLATAMNQANIRVNPTTALNLLTNYGTNDTDIRATSAQKNTTFSHMTEGRWRNASGITSSLAHTYSRIQSDTRTLDVRDFLVSNTQLINGIANIPTGLSNHEVGLRAGANIISDSKGYSNNQYMGGLANRYSHSTGPLSVRPQHTLRVTKGTLTNGGLHTESTDIQSRLRLDGERTQLPLTGSELRVKTEWEWRSREANSMQSVGPEKEVKNRYFVEVGLLHRFTQRMRVSGSVSRETETYSLSDVAGFPDDTVVLRPDQIRTLYRLEAQGQPTSRLTFTINGSWIEQNVARISRFTVSLSGRLPLMDMPLRSFLVSESKFLEGRGEQKLLQGEAQLSHSFRQVSLVLSFSIYKETLIFEDYTYTEFYVRLSRAFNII